MKHFLTITIVCFLSFSCKGQLIFTPDGEFMDTTFVGTPQCGDAIYYYYYSVDGKYPKNSTTLIKEAKAFLKDKPHYAEVNGYITFRFGVNCEGTISRFRVQQTDEKYNETHFDKNLVNDLHQFVLSLNPWPIGRDKDKKPINYVAFISFKIKNGEIIAIIP
jgi:hypothetical protein